MSRWPLIRVPASLIVTQFGCKSRIESKVQRLSNFLRHVFAKHATKRSLADPLCHPPSGAQGLRRHKNILSISLYNSGTRMHMLTRSLGCAFLSRLPSCHPMTKRRWRIELPSRNTRDRRE